MIIAQITDLHVSTPDSLNERELFTSAHLRRAIAHLESLVPRPDVVLATGDLVERGGADEYAILRGLFAELTIPLFVIPGNHDERSALRAAFDDCAYLPRDGFLHYVLEDYPVRLIGLDTVVAGKPHGELCDARLGWLEARLAEAPDRPTLLFMHHPPYASGLTVMDGMGLRGKEAFAELVMRHPQVERIIAGHLHRPTMRRVGGSVASTCPATAHQLALELTPLERLSLTMEPPQLALHVWLGPEDGLVSHLSMIGDAWPPVNVFDGQRWVTRPVVPPGFHGR